MRIFWSVLSSVRRLASGLRACACWLCPDQRSECHYHSDCWWHHHKPPSIIKTCVLLHVWCSNSVFLLASSMLKARFNDATFIGLCIQWVLLSLTRYSGEGWRRFHILWEKRERERQTHSPNARSSPVRVPDCLPKVCLRLETSFSFCCLENRKWNVKRLL